MPMQGLGVEWVDGRRRRRRRRVSMDDFIVVMLSR
jgi:hypothetical protein